MNKLVKNAMILALIGFVCGTLISVIMFIIGGGRDFIGNTLVLLLGGIFGAIPMGLAVVYDIESWSIAKATIVHFVATFSGFFALAYLQGWLKPGDLFFWLWTTLWVFAYFIIWLVQYLAYHRKISRMNDELKKIHSRKIF